MGFVRGLDFSLNQGVVTAADWRAIARGQIRFALIRCAEGPKDHDPRYDANVEGARSVGLAIGPYFVGEFGPGVDPIAQADAHWELARGCGAAAGDLAPVLDFEVPAPEDWGTRGVTGGLLATDAAAYATRLGARSGRVPILYSYPWFLKALADGGGAMDALADYPLWIAGYPHHVVWPAEGTQMPGHEPWGPAAMWQTSDGGGRLPSGCPVDTNVIASDEALARLRAA